MSFIRESFVCLLRLCSFYLHFKRFEFECLTPEVHFNVPISCSYWSLTLIENLFVLVCPRWRKGRRGRVCLKCKSAFYLQDGKLTILDFQLHFHTDKQALLIGPRTPAADVGGMFCFFSPPMLQVMHSLGADLWFLFTCNSFWTVWESLQMSLRYWNNISANYFKNF